MKLLGSLRLRLVAFAALVMAVALVAAGFGLTALFSRHLERRVGQELDTHIAQLSGSLRIAADGTLSLAREPADPRFARVYGGLYWQVADQTAGRELRSRSLWDSELQLPADPLHPGTIHVHDTTGPDGAPLLVHEQLVLVPVAGRDHELRVSVAINRQELAALEQGFARDVTPALALLGLVLLAGFAVQIGAGLKPMRAVRAGLADIREGRARRLAEAVPSEVAPLVREINELLDAQDADMARARDRAADLAHGLKTPLTALDSDIARLRDKGETAIAADIDELAARMRRHMERELARARIRHGRASDAPVATTLAGIVRTLQRTPAGDALAFDIDVPADLSVHVDADDLAELLGNLLENAARHAKGRVAVGAASSGGQVRIAVEDDGPGLAEDARAAVLARGKRLDEAGLTGAAGLGLAIVQDILAAYGGELSLDPSLLGGLRASVTLPG
ncbi:MAG: HAMP domain-containing histidine kinase [Rhodobiaceae bacterium]|nr:HAMP domain-containing histidine kinase [Rhodobiaceae bacterium]